MSLDEVGGNPHEADFPSARPAVNGPSLFPGFFAFSFVRNPWDRLVSCFRDKIQGHARDFTGIHPARGVAYCLAGFDVFTPAMSFERFVEVTAEIPDAEADDHFRSQYLFLSNDAGDIAIDFVGRFETLDTDFRSVFDRLGVVAPALPHRQATHPPVRYTSYFDERTKDVVARRFSRDIELFGYDFNPAPG